eukprot:scaffold43818_cov52-Phaeocystis_antarctica.AAC.2
MTRRFGRSWTWASSRATRPRRSLAGARRPRSASRAARTRAASPTSCSASRSCATRSPRTAPTRAAALATR